MARASQAKLDDRHATLSRNAAVSSWVLNAINCSPHISVERQRGKLCGLHKTLPLLGWGAEE
jgi:hypothetical protein